MQRKHWYNDRDNEQGFMDKYWRGVVASISGTRVDATSVFTFISHPPNVLTHRAIVSRRTESLGSDFSCHIQCTKKEMMKKSQTTIQRLTFPNTCSLDAISALEDIARNWFQFWVVLIELFSTVNMCITWATVAVDRWNCSNDQNSKWELTKDYPPNLKCALSNFSSSLARSDCFLSCQGFEQVFNCSCIEYLRYLTRCWTRKVQRVCDSPAGHWIMRAIMVRSKNLRHVIVIWLSDLPAKIIIVCTKEFERIVERLLLFIKKSPARLGDRIYVPAFCLYLWMYEVPPEVSFLSFTNLPEKCTAKNLPLLVSQTVPHTCVSLANSHVHHSSTFEMSPQPITTIYTSDAGEQNPGQDDDATKDFKRFEDFDQQKKSTFVSSSSRTWCFRSRIYSEERTPRMEPKSRDVCLQ